MTDAITLAPASDAAITLRNIAEAVIVVEQTQADAPAIRLLNGPPGEVAGPAGRGIDNFTTDLATIYRLASD